MRLVAFSRDQPHAFLRPNAETNQTVEVQRLHPQDTIRRSVWLVDHAVGKQAGKNFLLLMCVHARSMI